MKRHYFIIIFLLLTGAIVSGGCGSTKGYAGDKLEESETARIEGSTRNLRVKGKKTFEQTLLIKVDSLTVGSFMKGFPGYVNVMPGEITVEIRHFCKWIDKSAMAGAMFGIIGASIAESNNPHTHYRITFPTEKGQTYALMPDTDEETLKPHFVIINKTTGAAAEPLNVVEIQKKEPKDAP